MKRISVCQSYVSTILVFIEYNELNGGWDLSEYFIEFRSICRIFHRVQKHLQDIYLQTNESKTVYSIKNVLKTQGVLKTLGLRWKSQGNTELSHEIIQYFQWNSNSPCGHQGHCMFFVLLWQQIYSASLWEQSTVNIATEKRPEVFGKGFQV